MSTNWPSGTDVLTNPVGTNFLDVPDHAAQHTNANDAIEAIESNVGTNSGTNIFKSFVVGNFPARINSSNVPQQALNNGTFGTPTLTVGGDTVGDMYYRSAAGTLTRVATGATYGILRTDGTTASFGAAVSPYTSGTITGTTASVSAVDVPGGSIAVVNLGREVSIFAIATGRIYVNAAANITPMLVVNGTTLLAYDVGVIAAGINQGIPFALSGKIQATIGTVKMQFKTSAGTMTLEGGLQALVT